MITQEHSFTCPYCGEWISMVIEPTLDWQTYVEDCEVCCNPIQISFRVDERSGEGDGRGESDALEFIAESIDQ